MENSLNEELEQPENPWPRLFHEDRNPVEEESFIESRLRINPSDDPLLTFVRDYDEHTAEEEVITRFCSGVHRCALTNPCEIPSRKAWLDDRLWNHASSLVSHATHVINEGKAMAIRRKHPNISRETIVDAPSKDTVNKPCANSGLLQSNKHILSFREYKPPLDAFTLFCHLKQKRYANACLPDADRRLIYVSGLTPIFLYALIETATQHQSAALKTALYMHIARKTDMGVKISYKKYDMFELYFYVPFLDLSTYGDESTPLGNPTGSRRLESLDISSITGSGHQPSGRASQNLHIGHIAINICGVANHRWTGYAFVDGDEDMDGEEFDYTAMVQDQFAANGDVDANCPIWDPREYFLLIIPVRVEQIIKTWSWLIQKIETSQKGDALSLGVDDADIEDTATTFRRTQRAVKLLGILHDILSETNGCWADFSAPDGDIAYFEHTDGLSVTSRTQMKRCLLDLKSKFRKMRALQRRLETLERRYQRDVDSLERRLAVESNRAAKSSGAHASLMVAWISPVAIVSAFFSIPAPFGSFPRTEWSFAIAMFIVTVVLQLLIFVQHKEWRVLRTWLHRLHRGRPPSHASIECIKNNEDKQRTISRVGTTDPLVDYVV